MREGASGSRSPADGPQQRFLLNDSIDDLGARISPAQGSRQGGGNERRHAFQLHAFLAVRVYLPNNHKEFRSLWVNFSNKYYDPERGHELYQRYLAELVLADRLGFDAIVVNEHHTTAYSMMAAPNLIAAAIIPQTANAKICVWGTPPNPEYPNRLAEEYAMLDVLSKGRLEVAFPLGTGMEYWAHPVNPVTARERHKESIDIILQAWTQPGPRSYYGNFYT